MLAALLFACVFFYLQNSSLKKDYQQDLQLIYKRMGLVNTLFETKERSQVLLRAHIYAERAATKDSLRQELVSAFRLQDATLQQLNSTLRGEEQEHRLHELINDLGIYHSHIDTIIRLSDNMQETAAVAYSSANLAPFYTRNQSNLISLNKEFTSSALEHSSTFLPVFARLVDEYILLLLLVIPLILGASFAFSRITKRLQRENKRLNTEIRERETLQRKLEATRLDFERLFNSNPTPILVFDQHTLRFLEVNEAAVQEYGYTREEFLQLTVLDIRPAVDREEIKNHLSHLDKASFAQSERRTHMRKDGTTFQVKLQSHALPEKEGVYPRLVTSENVQRLEDYVTQLTKSEKQLREISSSIPGAVYQFQVDGHGNMSFPFVSDGIEDVAGVTPEEACKNASVLFESIHPEDLERVMKSIDDATRGFLPWLQDLRIWNKAGQKWIWIRGHGLPSSSEDGILLYNGTFIDITDQKEAQEKLTASEANLRALLDSSPQAIYLLNKELNVVLFNAVAAEEVKKITLKDLEAGQSIINFISEEQKNFLLESHERAMQGKPTIYETGSGELWFEVAIRPVFTPERQVVAVALSVHDISEQRKIVAAIRDSEAKLTKAQKLAKLGNWERDLQRDSMSMSDYLYTMHGVSPETFTPTFNGLLSFCHPKDREKAWQDYQLVIEEKTIVESEHRILLQDGTQKYLHHIMEPLLNHQGQVLKVLGTVQDVTEQKEKEKQIREARNRFQSTIENIPEVILSADADMQILYISPQCKDVTGYTESEFLQENLWRTIIHQDDLPEFQRRLRQEIAKGQKILHEMRITTRDGALKWVLLRMSPMLGKHGEVLRIDSSVSDISERKLVEAKRTLLTEQLQVQNQNLQQFAYIVSHNLRAPIANILGLTTIYNREHPEAELNRHVIDNLAKSAQHLDNTIRDLNDILTVRGQILDVAEEIYFESLLKDILKSISIELQNTDASVDYDFTEAPCTVTLRSYVHSILQNLITNAVKYRDPGRRPHIYIRSYKQNDYICIEISDNGLGIDLARVKGKLFGLYKRFHPHIDGKGLGLHLVKTQVDLLDGKIEVNSQVGKGTTFKVYI